MTKSCILLQEDAKGPSPYHDTKIEVNQNGRDGRLKVVINDKSPESCVNGSLD